MVFRKAKELPFLPLIENLSGLAWEISSDGMKRLSEVDESGDSLFRNAHEFYRDALKPGPSLEDLTTKFLSYLQKGFDEYEAKPPSDISFNYWSKIMLGTASTNAVMGPKFLQDHPGLLPSVWLVDRGFFFFVNRVPRMFAKKNYQARDRVLAALRDYFSDPKNKEGSAPMIWDRADQMYEKGMTLKDVAAYTYSAYNVSYVSRDKQTK